MFNFKAEFKRKENEFNLSDCAIEKIIFLSDDRYKNFKQNMLRDESFIAENKEEMWVDENNITHGILVMSENSNDGVFIDSSGYDYARYTAFIPTARDFIDMETGRVVALIVESRDTEISLDEIKERYGVSVSENNGIGTMVFEKLQQHENVAELEAKDGCFFIKYAEPQKGLSLRELLKMDLNDIHLCHKDEETDIATVVELNEQTLTNFGKTQWADVLNAKVTRIYEGSYGTQLEVSGVFPERLSEFSFMLAGHCSAEYFDKCVNGNEQNQSLTQGM
jgi:hypothetical protein